MAVPAPTNFAVINFSFEDGTLTGWTARPEPGPGLTTGTLTVTTDNPYAGSYRGQWIGNIPGGSTPAAHANVLNDCRGTVYPGQSITVNGAMGMNDRSNSANQGEVRIYWLDANDNIIGYNASQRIQGNSSSWRTLSVTGSAPAGAVYAAPGFWVRANGDGGMRIDNLSWNYKYDSTAQLTQPSSTAEGYKTTDNIPFRVTINAVGLTVQQVVYKRQLLVGVDWQPEEVMATVTEAPYAANAGAFAAGHYRAFAEVYMSDGTFIKTNMNEFDVVVPAPPATREYKASNSYTYLVNENILNLGSGLPPTAVVTGVNAQISASMQIISRVKDVAVDDIQQFTNYTPFDIINGGTFEIALMSKDAGRFTLLGSPMQTQVAIDRTAFTFNEAVRSDEYKLVFYSAGEAQYQAGGETELFNLGTVPGDQFQRHALGVRFYPTVGNKPSYADYGDAVVRMKIGKIKFQVYFDAGSVVYYFASPDRTKIIKGTLVAYNVDTGNFKNGDASGTLQLDGTLDIIQGDQRYIGDDWTIHSGEPTDTNLIGYVDIRPEDDGIGMSYNGLPTQASVHTNRSRYVFITANFYGDAKLNSIYGANGVGRGFAYNGTNFYTIQTQPDVSKDRPRHVAFHHSHLALGFDDGRVDLSVVGSPYDYSGDNGASSWATGDSVTGLLPLTGAILGVFCQKSIVGISGTTVDNFATQTLSPSLGAVEYTVTDMGFPVYANAYGVYTLAQTQQYGDYLGTPMSQPISPWLRPRLVRKYTSDKEVVVAWPVRSKNQYKLAFSDGYVMSMTMNYGQQSAPTFAKQKYFVTSPGVDYGELPLIMYPSIYPIAVSSQLDDGGEERIHVANLKADLPVIAPLTFENDLVNGQMADTTWLPSRPPGLTLDPMTMLTSVPGFDDIPFTWDSGSGRWIPGDVAIPGSGSHTYTMEQGSNTWTVTLNFLFS